MSSKLEIQMSTNIFLYLRYWKSEINKNWPNIILQTKVPVAPVRAPAHAPASTCDARGVTLLIIYASGVLLFISATHYGYQLTLVIFDSVWLWFPSSRGARGV